MQCCYLTCYSASKSAEYMYRTVTDVGFDGVWDVSVRKISVNFD